MYAFIAWGVSFAGKRWGGFATDNAGRDYANQTSRNLMKKRDKLSNVVFTNMDYAICNPYNTLIYCDPPYENTTQNGYSSGGFDSSAFWDKVAVWSQSNTVLVSEYSNPRNHPVVWTKATKENLSRKDSAVNDRVEKIMLIEEGSL